MMEYFFRFLVHNHILLFLLFHERLDAVGNVLLQVVVEETVVVAVVTLRPEQGYSLFLTDGKGLGCRRGDDD